MKDAVLAAVHTKRTAATYMDLRGDTHDVTLTSGFEHGFACRTNLGHPRVVPYSAILWLEFHNG